MEPIARFLDFITRNPFGNTIFTTLLSLAITWLLTWLLGKKHDELAWSIWIRGQAGWGMRSPESWISHGMPVRGDDHTVMTVAIWNNAAFTVEDIDLDTGIPLTISTTGAGKIKNVKVVRVSDPATNFTATLAKDRRSADIKFDYLNPGQGAIVDVVVPFTPPAGLRVKGSLRRIDKVSYGMLPIWPLIPMPGFIRRRTSWSTRHYLNMIFEIATGYYMIVVTGVPTLNNPKLDLWTAVDLITLVALFITMTTLYATQLRIRVPKALRDFGGRMNEV